ncbi:MAG: ATP-binding protein [Treponema sp.]|nr:ATP-binding protein [Treponema sp.]
MTLKKTLLILGLSALGFITVLAVTILVFMNSLYYEVNTTGLKNTALTLLAAIGDDRITEIFISDENEHLREIDIPVNAASAYRLTLIAPSGYVLWDSHITNRLVNHIDRDEIIAALEGRESSTRRNSISTGMNLLYYAMPVFGRDNAVIGVFRLSLSIPRFGTRISSVLYPFIIFTLLVVFAVMWVIVTFYRSLSTSLGKLVTIAQAGTPLLSGPESEEKIAPEFRSLEKTIKAFVHELNCKLEQAREEGSRLEAILNGMSEALFAMDSDLILHLVNPRARELFNLGNGNVSGLSLLEATRSAELTEAAKKALVSDVPTEMDLTFHIGAEKTFQVYLSPLSGKKSGLVIVLQDITRLVKLERIRKDFVANVSHELRTPIQLIKGFAETLLDTVSEQKNDDIKQIIHFTDIIQKNAGIMENLTNDLLILADLENNSSNGHSKEELYIASIIDEAVSSAGMQVKNNQIEIKVDCPHDLKAVLYGSLIIQALINLIDNGIKYSPPKSKVWINAYIDTSADERELIFEVRDKGIGISAEHQERIFERFYRVDRSRSRKAGGTGLGLSIVRHISLLHRGTAEVESHFGEGSIFKIRIPLAT